MPECSAVCTHACPNSNSNPPNSVKNLLSTGSSVACSRERERAPQRESDCQKLDCGSCCTHPCASAALAHGCRLAASCLPCAFSISQLAPHAHQLSLSTKGKQTDLQLWRIARGRPSTSQRAAVEAARSLLASRRSHSALRDRSHRYLILARSKFGSYESHSRTFDGVKIPRRLSNIV